MARLAVLAEQLRSSLWFIPALFAGGAFLLAFASLRIDRELSLVQGGFFAFGGTAEGARSVLSTIAQSMLTFTALVFTITMLVLQLASSQLSPRVMRTFLRDRSNQFVLGLFTATFLYTLLVLREIRSPDAGSPFVPGLSVFMAFGLLIASVGAFIFYIDHMAHAIRATSVLDSIAGETRRAIDRLLPEERDEEAETYGPSALPPVSETDRILKADQSGILVKVDAEQLVRALSDGDSYARIIPTVGDFVPVGGPLLRLTGRSDDEIVDLLRPYLALASERTPQQDIAFGFRQIVDVGVRALSPGTNDPTTAVQAIDRLHDLLRRIVGRPDPPLVHVDDEGKPRLLLGAREWPDYVHLAVDELRLSGGGQIQVMRRLRGLLEDLASVAPADRLPVLRQEEQQLDEAVADGFDGHRDQLRARQSKARLAGDVPGSRHPR